MKRLSILCSLLCIIAFTQCNKDETVSEDKEVVEEKELIEFTYNDVKYSSLYYFDQDEIPVFDNENVAEIYKKIDDLEVVVLDDELILYDELPEKYDFNENEDSEPQIVQSAVWEIGNASFYDNQSFGGKTFFRSIYNVAVDETLKDLTKFYADGVYWNDRITSVILFHPATYNGELGFQLFEDINFKGNRLTISLKDLGLYKKNLNDVSFNKLFRTWGDKTSSIRFFCVPKV